MTTKNVNDQHVAHLSAAFEADGFEVYAGSIVHFEGQVGMLAKHRTAVNYETGKKKRAYYVEGSHYQMGYLLGRLAEPDIARMTTEFVDNIVPSFVRRMEHAETGVNALEERHSLLVEILTRAMKKPLDEVRKHAPPAYIREIHGLLDGCKHAHSDTVVSEENLWLLNSGMDCLVALVYTGDFLGEEKALASASLKLLPQDLDVPIFCNGFAVFGEAADSHYFGRDCMFPTAEVMQDTFSLVIYNSKDSEESADLPIVSVTAPGIVGSIAVMNSRGVAGGVDMSPAGNCDAKDPGRDLFMLLRQSVEQGSSAEQAVDIMVDAPRGVTWNFIIADGAADKACVLEAGKSAEQLDFLSFPSPALHKFLPDQAFIDAHKSTPYRNGIMVRWSDYLYPQAYVENFDKKLWKHYNRQIFHSPIRLYPDAFAPKGYINRTYEEKNCPKSFYFAPQREQRDDVLLVINHFVVPEMRLCGMNPWTTFVVEGKLNDIQWRYDELNNQILTALEPSPGDSRKIDYAQARQLIDFLSPYGKFPNYYANNFKSTDGKESVIAGSVSLFDLKALTLESHFGYYCDEWVKVQLRNYLD